MVGNATKMVRDSTKVGGEDIMPHCQAPELPFGAFQAQKHFAV
jgi:hypothetical protein